MTQALARTEPAVSNLAKVTGFNDRVIQLVKATVCPGASPLELACFLYNAKRLGLDPMTRQIHFIKYDRTAPAEIVIGINGYRAQAESSGVYAGSDDAVFEYEDVGQPKGAPSKATVTVHKIVAGMKVDFTASARWKEFYPGDGKVGEQYRKRPHNQLAIRAESHALRKGFPQQTERLEIQDAPVTWEQAAAADVDARNDPTKIGRDAKRYEEIFVDDDDEVDNTRPRATGGRRSSAVSKAPVASPAPASDDERAAAIVDQAHAAAAQRDENVDEIEAARQVEHEGLLM
jgi:phage recombination protein Bet